jgi:hypothetical protein
VSRPPLPSYGAPRAATLVGEFPAYDPQESIKTLEVPVVHAAHVTEEVLVDDILELTPLAPVVSTVLPLPVAPPRRTTLRTTKVAPAPRNMGPWIAGGVAMGVLVSLGVAVVVRVVDARTPYPRTNVTVVQAAGATTTATATASTTATATAIASTTASRATAAATSGSVPSIALDTLPIVPATRGKLQFSVKARGHRVWVDGAVLGESDGPIDVRCGKHAIRVGSHGEAQDVDVPCGGDVLVK